jgi:hypothetical protein
MPRLFYRVMPLRTLLALLAIVLGPARVSSRHLISPLQTRPSHDFVALLSSRLLSVVVTKSPPARLLTLLYILCALFPLLILAAALHSPNRKHRFLPHVLSQRAMHRLNLSLSIGAFVCSLAVMFTPIDPPALLVTTLTPIPAAALAVTIFALQLASVLTHATNARVRVDRAKYAWLGAIVTALFLLMERCIAPAVMLVAEQDGSWRVIFPRGTVPYECENAVRYAKCAFMFSALAMSSKSVRHEKQDLQCEDSVNPSSMNWWYCDVYSMVVGRLGHPIGLQCGGVAARSKSLKSVKCRWCRGSQRNGRR